ncbi:activating transcription factor 7-interacting protein 1 isoform X2 [Hypomesus transpacificus]|nr:activating transcription factor 7-interacting protein 1 isoform X2 [Hypomesus transpacificus]XP_046899634.1 activating transcription factor 7-interacting protein 1 isoform X2 [Hypomesus transpacificus]
MEVAVAEEKKKIFRARKTMKISDRQQLETLHNSLSSSGRASSTSSSPPPLLNGTHKEDGQKGADSDTRDSKSPVFTPSTSPNSRSPPLGLSLSLSPSPPAVPSPKAKDDIPPSPSSPFHSLNNELRKIEEEGKKARSPSPPKECPQLSSAKEAKEGQAKEAVTAKAGKKQEETNGTEKEETRTATKSRTTSSVKESSPSCPVSPATSDKVSEKSQKPEQKDSVTVGTVTDSTEVKASEAPLAKKERSSSPKATTGSPEPSSSSSPSTGPVPAEDIKKVAIKSGKGDGDQGMKAEVKEDEKMEVDLKEKTEAKKVKKELKVEDLPSSSSSLSSNTAVKEEKSSSGHKRPLSEANVKDESNVDRDGKRQRRDGVELEAQLELKFTAKAGSRHKIEKVVQQLVEERMRVLQLTVFDQSLQELKERIDKIDCATKHQSALNTLQAKIARLAKKFGEANQSSENKTKEVLTTPVTKTPVSTNSTPMQRPVRTSMEVKQIPTTPVSTNPPVSPAQSKSIPPTSTTTTMVTPGPILQLISTSNTTTSTLGTSATQSQPTGTLLLKTAQGTNMVGQGQPVLIQLHPALSMPNGQPGTVVNIPVSSFTTVNSHNKPKTTTSTFILKAAPSTTTATTMVPAIQASTSQMTPAQISLARYQGGAGSISTPYAGVSVATARMPVQSVSVAGAVSSSSSPAASGPAATGSTAPGTPSGTTMTSKTDNQATGSTPTKTPVQGPRPKGSVIDLTEDDDDVQVTGVKKAVGIAAHRPPGPPPLISIPTGATATLSPQHPVSSPQHTVHHRPPLDSPVKTHLSTPSRTSSTALPSLPTAPLPATRLPQEAALTSLPQQPQLKLARVQSQNGIVLSWCVSETDRTCATVDSYHLYAYHMDNCAANGQALQHWKKIGEVKALPLPMACTLTQFVSGSTYYFAVRARDIYGRFGPFCEPQCTDVISSSSSAS